MIHQTLCLKHHHVYPIANKKNCSLVFPCFQRIVFYTNHACVLLCFIRQFLWNMSRLSHLICKRIDMLHEPQMFVLNNLFYDKNGEMKQCLELKRFSSVYCEHLASCLLSVILCCCVVCFGCFRSSGLYKNNKKTKILQIIGSIF